MTDKTPAVLFIKPGATVTHDGREFSILSIADLNMVLAREIESGEKFTLRLDEIGPPRLFGKIEKIHEKRRDLSEVSTEDWAVAEFRFSILKPLIEGSGNDRAYETAANQAGVHVATIYRWLADYQASGVLSALIPTKRPGGAGKGRLSAEVEAIIEDCVQRFFLTDQNPSIAKTVKEIRRVCFNAGLPLPAYNTVELRIGWITARERMARRVGEKKAREKYDPHKGQIPDAEWPLALVQMDHTLLPVIIVDDVYRKPINRAWITLLIDVKTRVCLGMWLSLDPPSAMSAGLCVAHAMLPKEKWLKRLGLDDIEWPFYGPMGILHLDNAREFRGDMLKTACDEYGIDIHLRPVKKPHYGAHIERLMGTVSEELKGLKGATFANPQQKGEYDAEGNACMTFDELEKWLVLMFARYHQSGHGGLGTSPKVKWREGIIGSKTKPGRGIPVRHLDEEKLRLDFMPFEERTVQPNGVSFDVLYWHDVLRPWVNAPDPKYPRHSRKFRFRRDPRDISQVYFHDPDTQQYFAIPYRDTGHPPVSIWEFRAARASAKEYGLDPDNEGVIFGLINRQREIEAQAAHKTKVARREEQRRIQHEKVRKERPTVMPKVSGNVKPIANVAAGGYNPTQVTAYEDEY